MPHPILIIFGGVSAEHEVSIITGLQVVEQIDRSRYTPHIIYFTRTGTAEYISPISSRRDFAQARRLALTWGRDSQGGYVRPSSLIPKIIYPQAAYIACHGGSGESGPLQGMLETLGIPHTGPSVQSSVLTMNKSVTKELLAHADIPVVPWQTVTSREILSDSLAVAERLIQWHKLPLIVKPVHLGSSIGITVAHTQIQLEKALLEAAHMDTEVVIERYLTPIVEYNCAVRMISGQIETSQIERPLGHDEILSFADKYASGAKKTGSTGMASLQRELPAKISRELTTKIQDYAHRAYIATRCQSMVRIDFMQSGDDLYLTEINPIPGSMAYYLWEASGLPFRQQITDMIEQAVRDHRSHQSLRLEYESDIVEKFITRQS